MESFKLFDAEYKFVNLIWQHEPINSTELVKVSLEVLGWKKSTTYTVLRKLCARGILRNNDAVVTALIKKSEAQQYESHTLIQKNFGGSLPQFLTAFLKENKITEKEAEELKHIIAEAAE